MNTVFEVGETIAIDRGVGGLIYDRYVSGTILRITPKGQYVVKAYNREMRFTKDGYEIGTTSRRDRIVKMTPEIVADMRRVELIDRFKHYTDWSKLPLDKLERVADAIA